MAIRNRERTGKVETDHQPAEKSRRDEPRRKAEPQRDVQRGPRSENAVIRYFRETGDELRKVSWPSRKEAIRLTLIVLGTTIVAGLLLGLLDLLFQTLASLLV